uniref:cytochrome c oxidase subunit 2 n=1 Tax=Lima vulgaris TaxID=2671060 RepID=UPI0028FCF6D7|nr:cytochrome c oxidase subunit 2 [Lima vulgaris]WNB40314.1 cytochrome c oxidase subunit 2 [Lima vulgaris]
MPVWGATIFPEPATAKAFGVQVLYSYVMVWVIFVGMFVCVSVALLVSASFHCRLNKGWQPLELLFTLVPISILLSLVCPSAVSLYWTDSFFVKAEPHVSVKVTGHQWYWEYEVSQAVAVEQGEDGLYSFQEGGWLEEDVNDESVFFLMLDSGESFESRVTGLGVTMEKTIVPEQVAVDNPLVLPWGVPIKFMFTSADVIHSWFVGALGVKVDATPGRMSSFETLISGMGVIYGVCSELCGVYHGFMPVKVESISPEDFVGYMGGDELEEDLLKVERQVMMAVAVGGGGAPDLIEVGESGEVADVIEVEMVNEAVGVVEGGVVSLSGESSEGGTTNLVEEQSEVVGPTVGGEEEGDVAEGGLSGVVGDEKIEGAGVVGDK